MPNIDCRAALITRRAFLEALFAADRACRELQLERAWAG